MRAHKTDIFVSLLLLVGITFAFPVFAQGTATDTFGISPVSQSIGLGGGDIRQMIGQGISILLGLLGTIAVGIVLYGGFVYMTAFELFFKIC